MADKECPTCHRKNKANASFCVYCGASLAFDVKNLPSTSRIGFDIEKEFKPATRLGAFKTPERGIAFYVTDSAAPIAIVEKSEFIIGRKLAEVKTEVFVDLTPYEAYEKGISHRHAMVRQVETGYEIIDLFSTNGTSVNNQQLVPLKPHILHSGSEIRLGKLILYAIFDAQKLEPDIP
jgi:hypothetical protein